MFHFCSHAKQQSAMAALQPHVGSRNKTDNRALRRDYAALQQK
jgi:hypothetical protein